MAPIAETIETLRPLIEEYGHLALFFVFVLEGAMLLYFAPSESLVPAAIWLFADAPIDYFAIVAIAVAGATAGQFLLFTVTKRGGREYLLRQRWFRIGEDRLDRFEGWFDRYGPVAVPVSNTLLFTRGMLTVPAGLAGMDGRRFLVASAVGTLSFETILAALAVAFPRALEHLGIA